MSELRMLSLAATIASLVLVATNAMRSASFHRGGCGSATPSGKAATAGGPQRTTRTISRENFFLQIKPRTCVFWTPFWGPFGCQNWAPQRHAVLKTLREGTGKCRVFLSGCIVRQELVKHLNAVFAIECRRWERNLKAQTILPLALASLVFGCGGQLSSDEAGLLDAVAFVTGGQEEGAIPQ